MQTEMDPSARSGMGRRLPKRQLEVAARWGNALLELRRVDADAALVIDDVRLEHSQPGRVDVGPLTFDIRWAPEVPRVRGRTEDLDFRFAKVMALVAMALASFALAAQAGSDLPSLDDDVLQRNRATIQRIFTAQAQPKPRSPSPSAPKHSGAEGQAATARAPKPRPTRDVAVSQKGVLGVLNRLGGASAQLFGTNGFSDQMNAALQGLHSGLADGKGVAGMGTRGTGPGGGGDSSLFGIGSAGTHNGRGPGGPGDLMLGDSEKRHVRVPWEEGKVVGGLSREEIERVIKRHQSEILFCYNSQLQKSPGLAGKVAVNFTIDGSGVISEAAVAQTSLENEAVERCVIDRIRRWRFPEPKGGGVVVVTYPWIFMEAGQE
ncbi:MAG: TonB family protein [Deltaproteobacteria bacterium]|nr:TonB family protein [Deltaproteobacteria bacterium]